MAKLYTQAQWARLQARLPEEDRAPYSDSPDAPTKKGPAEVRAADEGVAIAPVATPVSTAKSKYYNYYTGEWVDDPSLIKPREGMGGPESDGSTIQIEPPTKAAPDEEPETGYVTKGGILYFNGQPFTGVYNGQTYENGKVKSASSKTVASPSTTSTTMTPGQADVYSTMVARLNQYNLGALAPLIKNLAINGATESTIMLQLSEEPLYKQRFKANQDRIKKNLAVLTPSEYLKMEDSYRQILRAYGLTQFDNDDYVSQFISNDVSATELSNRVVTAVQRVRNADPAVTSMLKNFYNIGQGDLVAYVLDPEQQFQKIERQVAASEIGVAAARQGFDIGATVAEQLAAQGISQAEAQRGYSTIADILPAAEKLSDIYGGVEESYRLPEAEQEVFNQLASAQRKRQRLAGREAAAFSGASGLGRTSLTQGTTGQF